MQAKLAVVGVWFLHDKITQKTSYRTIDVYLAIDSYERHVSTRLPFIEAPRPPPNGIGVREAHRAERNVYTIFLRGSCVFRLPRTSY